MLKFVYLGWEFGSVSIGSNSKYPSEFARTNLRGIKFIRELIHFDMHTTERERDRDTICLWIRFGSGVLLFSKYKWFSFWWTETVMRAHFFHFPYSLSGEARTLGRSIDWKVAKCSRKWHWQPKKAMRFIMMKSVNVLAHKNFFTMFRMRGHIFVECRFYNGMCW